MRKGFNFILTFFLATQSFAALPQFLGGSGFGINATKANLDGNYPTYWESLMKEQSKENLRQGLGDLAAARYKEASQIFAKAVVKNPDEPYTHIFLGISLYWQGQVQPAIAEYLSALKLDKKNPEAHQLLGISYAWQGKIKEALKCFKTALKYAPNRPDTHMNLGSTYAALGNYEDALYHFRTATDLDKRNPLYFHQLGSLLEILGRDANAKDAFKQALALYPRYEEALLSLAVLEEKLDNKNNAKIDYKKALRLKPGDSVARARFINLLLEDNESQDAIPLFAQGFLISPLEDGGLALSLTYSGSENQAQGQTQKNKNKGAQTLPQQFKNPQLESFKKRLKKVPATKQINIEVEVALDPKQKPSTLKTNNVKEGTRSAFANAVLEQEKALSTTTFERSFILVSSDEETRQNQLESIFSGLNNVLQNAEQDYQVKMALKASTPTQDPTTLQQAETGPSSISTMRNNSKAGYNPYMVGNDMGLWVAGKGWIRFMEDILPTVTARFEENKNFENSLLLALTYLTLGQGQEAIKTLKMTQTKAQSTQEKALAYLAQGTAFVVLGDETHAKELYALALKEDPENKIIKSNIAILED
ncbi:MAG: tetratricopeptide repeat protein [Elusimicrobiaceae bacterium]|nr:tetratricopeptide repeat protein [Elusimicrobiaceae bacterium]